MPDLIEKGVSTEAPDAAATLEEATAVVERSRMGAYLERQNSPEGYAILVAAVFRDIQEAKASTPNQEE